MFQLLFISLIKIILSKDICENRLNPYTSSECFDLSTKDGYSCCHLATTNSSACKEFTNEQAKNAKETAKGISDVKFLTCKSSSSLNKCKEVSNPEQVDCLNAISEDDKNDCCYVIMEEDEKISYTCKEVKRIHSATYSRTILEDECKGKCKLKGLTCPNKQLNMSCESIRPSSEDDCSNSYLVNKDNQCCYFEFTRSFYGGKVKKCYEKNSTATPESFEARCRMEEIMGCTFSKMVCKSNYIINNIALLFMLFIIIY